MNRSTSTEGKLEEALLRYFVQSSRRGPVVQNLPLTPMSVPSARNTVYAPFFVRSSSTNGCTSAVGTNDFHSAKKSGTRDWRRVVWYAGCGEGGGKVPRKRDNGSERPWEREKEKWDARYKEEVVVMVAAARRWRTGRVRVKEKEKEISPFAGGEWLLREGKNVWLLRVTHGFLRANNNIYETHRCAPHTRYLSSCW